MNNYPCIISSIIVNNAVIDPIKVCGDLRLDKNRQQGIPFYQLSGNPSISQFRDLILELLSNDNNLVSPTLSINKAVLDDEELLNAIRDFSRRKNISINIRIIDDDYSLTREDFDRLSFCDNIFVDYVDDGVESNNIYQQHGVFKMDIQSYVQPVVERRSQFDEMVTRVAFHVNHRLSDEEFEYLASTMDGIDGLSIELDYFDPDYYEEFLSKLQKYTNTSNIHIQLIGYLLEDNLNIYERLEKFPYEIDVVYSTCHDMIDMYEREPYTQSRGYRSTVEGGGITSLGNYLNILENVTSFEETVNALELSPLEAAVYAKLRIDSEYIYDPDFESDNVDAWDNVNLSQIINHEVDGRKRAVCLGFSTLYSAYLRRTGIPMFRYTTTAHSRNIGRIKDDEYNVDTICVSDVTWDLPDQNGGYYARNHFMIAPGDIIKHTNNNEHELLTIADTFVLSMDECNRLLPYTNDLYEMFYHPYYYDPRGYSARLLQLMGVVDENQDLVFYDTIYNLNEQGHFEGIPIETLDRAYNNVFRKMRLNETDINTYFTCLGITDFRDHLYMNDPAIRGVSTDPPYTEMDYPTEVLTKDNIGEARRRLEEDDSLRLIYLAHDLDDENNINISDSFNEVNEDEIDNQVDTIDEQPVEEIKDEQIVKDNLDYVHQLLNYCIENGIGIYNYFINLSRYYRNEENYVVPEFEKTNPFIDQNDISLLVESNDNLIGHYFATSMMRTVSLNISLEERDSYNDLFSKDDENYTNALLEEDRERIIKRIEKYDVISDTENNNLNDEELDENEFSEEMIPGTDIHKPRWRRHNESDEEYIEFLRNFYERHFPNADYVNNLINYCQTNNINLYDYYINVGRSITGDNSVILPDFEKGNPFISENDINILLSSNDDMITTYFATAMMNTIGLNVSNFKKDDLQNMFKENVEIFNEEISRRV